MATLKEGQLVRIISKEAIYKSDSAKGIAGWYMPDKSFKPFREFPLSTIYRVSYENVLGRKSCRLVPTEFDFKVTTDNIVLQECLVPVNTRPIL